MEKVFGSKPRLAIGKACFHKYCPPSKNLSELDPIGRKPLHRMLPQSTSPSLHEKAIFVLPVAFPKSNIFERNGNFHVSENGCALVLQKDLEYWIIDELIMEACCALKYFPQIEVIVIHSCLIQFIGLIITLSMSMMMILTRFAKMRRTATSWRPKRR